MALAIRFHDQLAGTSQSSLRDETLAGFAATPKWTSPKFFYDQRGSELFEAITRQPEYYPTRTEELILTRAADEIAAIAGPEADLIEFGSGASRKVRLLLEALQPASYLGIDISEDFLRSSTQRLAADYPWLDVHACAPTSVPNCTCPGASTVPARWPSSPARASATSPRPRRSSSSPACTACCRSAAACWSASTWSRTRPCWKRPTTMPPASPRPST